MAEIVAGNIPYERDIDPLSSRMCGPAALCMVYRSFGIDCSQGEVAAQIAKLGPAGKTGARTFLVAQDALARGLSALVFRASDPVRVLGTTDTSSLRLILNHRPRRESPAGHFTVLLRVENDNVVVHDPQIGPNRRILLADLLELWRPLSASSEITGNVLIAVAKDRQSPAPCPKCGTMIPETTTCPGCRKPIPLHPAAVLKCTNASCPERTWECLFCPYCDTIVVDLSGKIPDTASREKQGAKAATDDIAAKVKLASQGIDKFLGVLMSINNGQPSPTLLNYINSIRMYHAQMLETQQKEAAARQARAAHPPPAPAPEAAPPSAPVPPKPAPRSPVDWNELGRKLVEEISEQPGGGQTLVKDASPPAAPPEEPALPSAPGVQPATPRPPAPARKPESQEEPARVEYEPPNWDTLDVRE